MSVSYTEVIPQCIDTIFECAEADPFLIQSHPDQVEWTHEGQRVNLYRIPGLQCYFLQVSDVDPDIVATDVYLFNNHCLVKSIRAFAPTTEASGSNDFIFRAINDPHNGGSVTEHDEIQFFAALLSGLRTCE